MLLVDKVIEIGPEHIGIKNVGRPMSHFSKVTSLMSMVMPGVLQVESMAQIGGLLILNQLPKPRGVLYLLPTIDNVKFRQKVVPGDTSRVKVSLTSPYGGIANMRGVAFIGSNCL